MADDVIIPEEPSVIRLLRSQRDKLTSLEEEQLRRMASHWIQIEQNLQEEMILLAQQLQEAKASGAVITEQLIAKLSRYETLNSSLKEQILKYAKEGASEEITQQQLIYFQLGIDTASIGINSLQAGLSFNTLSVAQFEDLAGLLADGSPLYKLLKEAYPESLDGIIKGLLEGTARGLGPIQVAQMMAEKMGMGLERMILIARTEQLRAWRTSTARQYVESGVVQYSMRVCDRGPRTCVACLLADGEIIPLGEVLSDHPRGRCTTVPVIKGQRPVDWQHGEEWFLSQSEDFQKDALGPGMYNLWKEEKFDIQQLLGRSYDPVYGSAPRVRSLAEVREMLGLSV